MRVLQANQRRYFSVRSFLSCTSLLTLTGCSTNREERDVRTAPPLVPVMQAMPGLGSTTSYTGVVRARVESSLGFRVPGKIIERLVDTGKSVKRGQPLYRLDRTDLQHNLNARQESVSSQKGSAESKQGAVEAARAHLVQAEADERRYKNALSVGVATEQAYDQYRAAADSARADLYAAQAEVNAAKNQISALQAQERVAANESSYSTLCADVDGVVTDVLAEPGQVVAVGQTVVRIARKGPREAAVDLPETMRPPLGSTALAKVFNTDLPVCRAKLRQLSDSAEPLTRTFEARYVLTGAAEIAPLGSTVTITPEASNKKTAGWAVPLTALIDKGKGPAIWILDASTELVHLRPVTISTIGNEEALITTGLKQSELYVAQGAHLLHENDKIRPKITAVYAAPAPLSTPPHESQ